MFNITKRHALHLLLCGLVPFWVIIIIRIKGYDLSNLQAGIIGGLLYIPISIAFMIYDNSNG